jgi:hypothetical protein
MKIPFCLRRLSEARGGSPWNPDNPSGKKNTAIAGVTLPEGLLKVFRGVQGAPRRGEPIRGGSVPGDVFDNSTLTQNLHLPPLAEKKTWLPEAISGLTRHQSLVCPFFPFFVTQRNTL